jgi:hypothetical protein
LAASALVGLAFAFISALYDFEPSLLLAVFVSTIGIGISQSVAAHFQGQRQFALAMPFTQMQNWLLMLIGIIASSCRITTATLPSALIALAWLLTATLGWFMVAHVRRMAAHNPQRKICGAKRFR